MNRTVKVIALFLCLLAAASQAGDDSLRNRRLEELRQEAGKKIPEIEQALEQCLKKVNVNQRPDDAFISSAKLILEDSKKFAPVFDDTQKSKFMLLQSWTEFFDAKMRGAVNWSSRACRADLSYQDAWISQALFSLLNKKKPMERRAQPNRSKDQQRRRTESGRRRNRDQEDQTAQIKTELPRLNPGVLEYDPETLRKDMYKLKFSRLSLKDIDGQQITFVPGQSALCVFFWQVEEASDTDQQAQIAGRENAVRKDNLRDAFSVSLDPKYSIENQTDFFNWLYTACKDHEGITCVQINTNRLDTARKLFQELPGNTSQQTVAPLIFAADPDSGAESYQNLDTTSPFMIVADDQGDVIYAGIASHFMPAFIITELTGIEIDLEKKQTKSNTNNNRLTDYVIPALPRPRMQQAKRSSRAADPNISVSEPNTPAKPGSSRIASRESQQKPGVAPMSAEDQVRAQHLLTTAELDIEKSRKSLGNPREGIEAARQVIREFPNTEFAQRARELLRRVPDRWKRINSITDKELGY